MFFLSEIEHTLRLPPHLLSLPLNDAIKGQLESLFLDKVVENLGLCISFYDIRHIAGGFVFPGHGASTYTVKFRLVMFRPFVGEVISARLKESNKDGLRLSLGFFDDIYVPVPLLPQPNHSEPDPHNKDGVTWSWKYVEQKDQKDGVEGAVILYPIDGVDEIRFRVDSVTYKPSPLEPAKDSDQKDAKPFAPMVVKGSLDADGLGPISWWGSNVEEVDGDEGAGDEATLEEMGSLKV